jgi:hypothetical protein
MKTSLLFIVTVCLFGAGQVQAQLFVNIPPNEPVHLDWRQQQVEFVPGQILVKFKYDVELQLTTAGNRVDTNYPELTSLFAEHNV